MQKNNILPIVKLSLIIASTTIVAALVLNSYCDYFSYLGLMAKRRLIENPTLAFITTPCFFWMSSYICRKYSPHASGNSMGHVKIAMRDAQHKPIDHAKILHGLNVRVIIVKIISSLLCSFGGGALGREGPSVHVSTAFFAVVGNKFKSLSSKITLESWVFMGSAAGIAIAFHAPLSGFVFILEKSVTLKALKFKHTISQTIKRLLKFKASNFRNTFVFSLVVIAIYNLIYKAHPMFSLSIFYFETSILSYLIAILTAIICGLFALIFKMINSHLYNKVTAIKSNLWHLVPISGGIAVAMISSYSGVYSFSGGIYTATEVLSSSEILLSYTEVIGRAANTMISFISGCAGGLIAPAIALGAGIGSIASTVTSDIDTNVFILIGMAAFLGAILGNPITAAIIIFEITGQSINALPILLCTSFIASYSLKAMRKILHQKEEENSLQTFIS